MQSLKSRKVVSLRLDPGIYDQLQMIAKGEERSVNQQIVYYISKMLEKEQQSDHPTQDNHSSFGS